MCATAGSCRKMRLLALVSAEAFVADAADWRASRELSEEQEIGVIVGIEILRHHSICTAC